MELAADRVRIATIEVEILDLQRSISALRAEKAVAEERIHSYKYPVLTIPNEIVSEIFTHLLPAYPLCPESIGVLSLACLTQLRWEYLQLRLELQHRITIKGPIPLLRHLDLAFDCTDVYVWVSDAPLLRTVILDIGAVSSVTLPWTQLTSLTLRQITIFNSSRVLRDTPNLVHCELDLCSDDEDAEIIAMDRQLTFPFLESLACNMLDAGRMDGYINTFMVPALRRLQLTEILLEPNPLDVLASFISKSGCKLQEVCITGGGTVTKKDYAKAFPSIKVSFSGQYQDAGYWNDVDSAADESGSESG
ncbi:hypothetical protein DFH06DRAFT_1333524 [Mycena polygramma]|nr:hypothetical protein DFH06DRAFT_1333524 [Mycena polygramma]